MGKKKNNKKKKNNQNIQSKQKNQNNKNKQNKSQKVKVVADKKKVAPEAKVSLKKEKKEINLCTKKELEAVKNEVEQVKTQAIEQNFEGQTEAVSTEELYEGSAKAMRTGQERLKLWMGVINEKLDDIWNFISETRKISVPLIILIYTAVIVAITIPIEHANVIRKLDRQTTLKEQMAAQQGGLVLEKDAVVEVSPECKVIYRGYEFTKSVTAQNSNQFGNAYENNSESNTYLDIRLEYTHSGSNSLRADKAAQMTVKSGQSQYLSFSAIETDEGKNIEFANGSQINSGETVQLHYIFDVPKALESGNEPLTVDVVVDNKAYSINLR